MNKLKRSGDAKVAARLTPGGDCAIPNSFGIPSGTQYSCPSATSICGSVCYAGKLEKIRPNVRAAMLHNWALVEHASYAELVAMLDEIVADFEADCDRYTRKGKPAPKLFRIHWDGDFFKPTYTAAWRKVIKNHPDTRFWAYTRVPSAALGLRGLENLALYFSADAENLATARAMQDLGIRVAALGDTWEHAREIAGAPAGICPEQSGKLPQAGACVACGLCIEGRINIRFKIKK